MSDDKKKRTGKHTPSEPVDTGSFAGVTASSVPEQTTTAQADALQAELDQACTQAREYSDGWQRERADFINYKRRIEREQAQIQGTLTGQIIKKYLVILDDLALALKSRPTEGDGATWSNGIELIYRKLQTILESEGVTRIPAELEFFDPNRHEALMQEDSPNHESGQIIEVLQQGYTIGDRVLRPARVRVAR